MKRKFQFHWLFKIKEIIKKQGPNLKKNKIKGLLWKCAGKALKLKMREEKKKKKRNGN